MPTSTSTREVTGWRDLAASPVPTLADGRIQLMAPETVNNHLSHLSAFFHLDRRARPDRAADTRRPHRTGRAAATAGTGAAGVG
ncbi:hypothetical protein FAIPA1_580004 [Frankia sp. AiPs1]